MRYSPTIDRSHEGASTDQDKVKIYPDRCTRARRNCPQCALEGKIQCAPRIPTRCGKIKGSRPDIPAGKAGVRTHSRKKAQ